jgi:hypothetical protein
VGDAARTSEESPSTALGDEGCRVSPRARVIASASVLAVRSGGRCPHRLGAIYKVSVGQAAEWLPAELVGDHYEVHDCVPRAWHPVPIVSKVL